jgi:DNA-directed RNA polymerase specialized sigma24 family protein
LDSAALDEPHLPPPKAAADGADVHPPMDAAEFAALYDENVAFVHRAVRRLGIHEPALEDVVQEVFLTAFRRHASFRR